MHVADTRVKRILNIHRARKWLRGACIGKICATRSKSRAFPIIIQHQTCMNNLTNSQRTLSYLRTLPLFLTSSLPFPSPCISLFPGFQSWPCTETIQAPMVRNVPSLRGSRNICLLPEWPASSTHPRRNRHLPPPTLLHLSENIRETFVGRPFTHLDH